MGYSKDAFRGISWMMSLRVFTRVIAYIKIAILARLLGPAEFGIFGIASLVLAFLEIVTESGVNAILIQGEVSIDDYIDTAWVVSIFRGLIISFLILVLSIPISRFFDTPSSVRVLTLMSLVPLLRGFINPAIVKFQKELNFDKEFKFRSVIFTFDAVVVVLLTIMLRSVEAIVLGLIAGVLLEIILSMLFVLPKPGLRFNWEEVKKVVGRGKWITLSGIFNYLFQNIDDIVVGKLMGNYSLGLYQMAYKISTLPITEAGEVVYKVTFPVYSKITHDTKRLASAYKKVVIMTALLTIPVGLIFVIFSRQIILVFLGEQWLFASSALKVLAIYGVIRGIFGTSSSLFLALKKQEYTAVITFTAMLGLSLFVVPLVKLYGIYGAGWAALVGWIIAIPIVIANLRRVFGKGA